MSLRHYLERVYRGRTRPVKTALWDALGPVAPGLNVLAPLTAGVLSKDKDILVTFSPPDTKTDVTVQMHLKKEFTASTSFDFGLGLAGIPLRVDAAGNVQI